MGKSMYPTYPNEGITLTYKLVYPVLLEKIGLLHNQIERFDIVYLKSNDGNRMAKRVIGLPGETISCSNEKVYINGNLVKEKYLETDYVKKIRESHSFTGKIEKIKLKENEYFVMGDNRYKSTDSRIYGPVKLSQIYGIMSEKYIRIG